MYKNQLQELAQRSCFNLPSYACIREGPDHAPRFKAVVNFNGETFESPAFCNTLRQAEHSAAEVALTALSKRGPSKSLAARVLDETGVYKNLLQETAHRAGLNLPVYTTIRSGPGHTSVFTCTVELAGMSFTGDPAKTKKQAQKNAAMAAWCALKQLPNSGSFSSFPSFLDSEKNEEQEQVIIARALAKMHSADGNELAPNIWHHVQPQQSLLQQDISAARSVFVDSRQPYQGLACTNFHPGKVIRHIWHQEQFLQQNHLLTLQAVATNDLNNYSPIHSAQPPQHRHFAVMQQELPSSIPCYTESNPFSAHSFTGYSLPTPRDRTQVTIQEISEEKNTIEDKELFPIGNSDDAERERRKQKSNLPSSATSGSHLVYSYHLSGDSSADFEFMDLMKDKHTDGGLHFTDVSASEPNITNHTANPVLTYARTCTVDNSAGNESHQEIRQIGNQASEFNWTQCSPRRQGAPRQTHSTLMTRNHQVRDPAWSSSSPHPPPAMTSSRPSSRSFLPPQVLGMTGKEVGSVAPVYGRGQRFGAFRPRSHLVAAPVTVRTAIPVFSARSVSHYTSPAVHDRSVAPICSTPAATPSSIQTRSPETGGSRTTTLEIGRLHV